MHYPNLKTCPACGIWHERPHSYCVSCHAAYMREWRKSHPLTVEQRRKMNARCYAGVLLQRGKIRRRPCRVCGAVAQMHHPDYSKPREVIWLCRKHHLQHHRDVIM